VSRTVQYDICIIVGTLVLQQSNNVNSTDLIRKKLQEFLNYSFRVYDHLYELHYQVIHIYNVITCVPDSWFGVL